jgi:hypothetical protein
MAEWTGCVGSCIYISTFSTSLIRLGRLDIVWPKRLDKFGFIEVGERKNHESVVFFKDTTLEKEETHRQDYSTSK